MDGMGWYFSPFLIFMLLMLMSRPKAPRASAFRFINKFPSFLQRDPGGGDIHKATNHSILALN